MESNREQLLSLIECNAITPDNIDDAVALSKVKASPNAWLFFINNLFLWLGVITFALSVTFFIAYNWSQLGRFTKFSLVEGALIISILSYLKVPRGSMSSCATLICASMILGTLLALVGQTYQTGADPWQLFFVWALLITPWVVIAQFASLWVIWLVLLNLSIILYCDAHPNTFAFWFDSQATLLWTLFTFNTLNLVIWQIMSSRFIWLNKAWATRLIALTAGSTITMLALFSIFDVNNGSTLYLSSWAIFFIGIYWFYRKITIDLFMLAGSCLSGIVVSISFLGKGLLNNGDVGAFLILAMAVIGLGAAAAFWLKKVQMETKHDA